MSTRPSAVVTIAGALVSLVLLTVLLAAFVAAISQGIGGLGLLAVGALCVTAAAATVVFYRQGRTMAPAPVRVPVKVTAETRRRPSPRPR